MAKCIFCGEGRQTKTHIFRKAWLEELFPSDQPFVHRMTRDGDSGFDRWWEAREVDLAPHAACAPCNNEWMSDIDYAAEALIETCVLGSAASFDRDDEIETLATWMTLVAILFNQTQEKPILSPELHAAFLADPRPIVGSFMWFAGTPDPAHEANGWPQTWGMKSTSDETNGYFCTFRIKHLVGQVYLPPHGNSQNIEFDRAGNPQIVPLWPSERAWWPPDQLIRSDQLELFARAFINA